MHIKKKLAAACLVLGLLALTACGSDGGNYYQDQDNVIHYHASIDNLFTQYFEKLAVLDPQFVTSQGYSQDIAPRQDDKLTHVSFGYQEWKIELAKNTLEVLGQYSDADLTQDQIVNKNILQWSLEHTIAGEEFIYHDTLQMDKIPELIYFMQSKHTIETVEDAENYLARLEQFAVIFNQLQTNLEIQADKEIVAPISLLDRLYHVLTDLERPENHLSNDFAAKVEKLAEKDQLVQRCHNIFNDKIAPAAAQLRTQVYGMRSQKIQNLGDLPQGKEYYAWLLRGQTTTDMSPEEVHQMALEEVDRLQGEIEEMLATLGYDSSSNPSDVLAKLRSENVAQENMVEYYTELVETAEEFLPLFFGRLPQTPVVVQGVDYRTVAYYPPSRDGSSPGIFATYTGSDYEFPAVNAKWLTWHESIPGHHIQFAIEHEAEIPYFRDYNYFIGYFEGWATYAEMLFFEFDLVDDPLGYLSDLDRYLMLAARTVIETGINCMGWSRQEAIDYMDETAGTAWNGSVVADDAIARPGRSASYYVGMWKIRQLRDKTERELGEAYDIREFHDLILQYGSMPLVVLEEMVDQYIADNK